MSPESGEARLAAAGGRGFSPETHCDSEVLKLKAISSCSGEEWKVAQGSGIEPSYRYGFNLYLPSRIGKMRYAAT